MTKEEESSLVVERKEEWLTGWSRFKLNLSFDSHGSSLIISPIRIPPLVHVVEREGGRQTYVEEYYLPD